MNASTPHMTLPTLPEPDMHNMTYPEVLEHLSELREYLFNMPKTLLAIRDQLQSITTRGWYQNHSVDSVKLTNIQVRATQARFLRHFLGGGGIKINLVAVFWSSHFSVCSLRNLAR